MAGKVRAKVWVREIVQFLGWRDGAQNVMQERVNFSFVAGNDPDSENAKFWSSTPSGDFWMAIANPGAMGLFEVGREYYLDIIPAEMRS